MKYDSSAQNAHVLIFTGKKYNGVLLGLSIPHSSVDQYELEIPLAHSVTDRTRRKIVSVQKALSFVLPFYKFILKENRLK